MLIHDLEKMLYMSWSAETSYDPTYWTQGNPSYGQCAVSSLIVQYYFGGEILWAEVELPSGEKISHYFNQIDGKEVDVTRSQFPENAIIPIGIVKYEGENMRERMLSNTHTAKRYEVLLQRVQEQFLS